MFVHQLIEILANSVRAQCSSTGVDRLQGHQKCVIDGTSVACSPFPCASAPFRVFLSFLLQYHAPFGWSMHWTSCSLAWLQCAFRTCRTTGTAEVFTMWLLQVSMWAGDCVTGNRSGVPNFFSFIAFNHSFHQCMGVLVDDSWRVTFRVKCPTFHSRRLAFVATRRLLDWRGTPIASIRVLSACTRGDCRLFQRRPALSHCACLWLVTTADTIATEVATLL